MPRKNKDERRIYNREYREKNKERLDKKRKEWVEKNKEVMKEYHREYHKKWYADNKEKRKEEIRHYGKTHKEGNRKRSKKYVSQHKEKVSKYGTVYNRTVSGAYRSYKSSSRKRNKEFCISIEKFAQIVSGSCKYCGESVEKRGIDRVDNNLGYTESNSVACCKICNFMKKTFSVQEFLSHITKIAIFNKITRNHKVL